MSDKKFLLVVEDDGALCAQLGMIVEYFGYESALAGTCAEARQKFKERKPDAVLSDLYLPDGTGVELLHEFHETDGNLPVIILTGFPSPETIRQTLIEGGYTYLAKPVDLVQLRNLLKRALGEN
ncbi:response regulator [bacterium]|nr:response regulator [bacterium]MBU1983228.1 response regulator [bacterium]